MSAVPVALIGGGGAVDVEFKGRGATRTDNKGCCPLVGAPSVDHFAVDNRQTTIDTRFESSGEPVMGKCSTKTNNNSLAIVLNYAQPGRRA